MRTGMLKLLFLCVLSTLSAAAGELRIVTTTTDLADITRRIAGKHATVSSIATGKEDPHFLQAKPSYIVRARKADVWIRIGMELEIGWEGPILDGSRNRRIAVGTDGHVDASKQVLRLEVHTHKVDRSMGDIHPHGNPHYWLDPLNGRMMARTIATRLSKLAPEHQKDFETNLKAFEKDLDERMFGEELVAAVGGTKLWTLVVNDKLDQELKAKGLSGKVGGWLAKMAPFKGHKIITYHRSWVYLTNRFGLKVAAELEPKCGIPPSPRHLVKVSQLAKKEKIKAILFEPFYSPKAVNFVAGRSSAKAVACANTVGGDAGATSYLEMLDQVITKLSQAMAAK